MEDRLVLVLWMWLGIAIALDEVPEDAGDEDAFVNLDTRLRAYGEIGVDFKSNAHPLGFDVGDTVISYEANLGEHVGILSDFVFGLGHHGQWLALVDQMRIDLHLAESVTLSAGKLYLPVGYWNTNIPYGGFLYAPRTRPAMLQFERHGAPIPIHQSGVDLTAIAYSGLWQIGTHVGVGNGRSGYLNETQDIGDGGPEKATWAQVYLQSPGEVQFGLSGYFDPRVQVNRQSHEFTQDHGDQGADDVEPHSHNGQILLQQDTLEAIFGAHLAWEGVRTQLLLEGMVVWHQRRNERLELKPTEFPLVYNLDGYAQLAHEIQKTTPYLRIDYVEYFYDDPLYRDMGRLRVTGMVSVGSRIDLAPLAALKLETTAQRDVVFPIGQGNVETRQRLGAGAQLVAGF